jgi:chromosome partitioning protein
MIVLFGGEKGGTGKTTLATNIAAMRAKAGSDVLLIDTDQQGSASFWAQCRDEEKIEPRVSCVQKFGKGLQSEVKDLATRFQDIIIDAGGRESIELRAGLVVSEKAFIPIQASQFDVWTLTRMNELVNSAQGFNPSLEAYVIISRSSTNPSVTETTEVQEMLKEFESLSMAKTLVRDRIAFRKAARLGCSVKELVPEDAKASVEIKALYKEVFGGK